MFILRFNTKKYSYTGNGLLLWEEDALGNRTTYLYKPDSVRPYASVSPEGYEFKYGYDAADRKTEVTTSKGTVSYRYNGLHYVSRTVDPLGNSQREEYDNLGNLIRKFSGRQSEASTDGTGYSYRYDYLVVVKLFCNTFG